MADSEDIEEDEEEAPAPNQSLDDYYVTRATRLGLRRYYLARYLFERIAGVPFLDFSEQDFVNEAVSAYYRAVRAGYVQWSLEDQVFFALDKMIAHHWQLPKRTLADTLRLIRRACLHPSRQHREALALSPEEMQRAIFEEGRSGSSYGDLVRSIQERSLVSLDQNPELRRETELTPEIPRLYDSPPPTPGVARELITRVLSYYPLYFYRNTPGLLERAVDILMKYLCFTRNEKYTLKEIALNYSVTGSAIGRVKDLALASLYRALTGELPSQIYLDASFDLRQWREAVEALRDILGNVLDDHQKDSNRPVPFLAGRETADRRAPYRHKPLTEKEEGELLEWAQANFSISERALLPLVLKKTSAADMAPLTRMSPEKVGSLKKRVLGKLRFWITLGALDRFGSPEQIREALVDLTSETTLGRALRHLDLSLVFELSGADTDRIAELVAQFYPDRFSYEEISEALRGHFKEITDRVVPRASKRKRSPREVLSAVRSLADRVGEARSRRKRTAFARLVRDLLYPLMRRDEETGSHQGLEALRLEVDRLGDDLFFQGIARETYEFYRQARAFSPKGYKGGAEPLIPAQRYSVWQALRSLENPKERCAILASEARVGKTITAVLAALNIRDAAGNYPVRRILYTTTNAAKYEVGQEIKRRIDEGMKCRVIVVEGMNPAKESGASRQDSIERAIREAESLPEREGAVVLVAHYESVRDFPDLLSRFAPDAHIIDEIENLRHGDDTVRAPVIFNIPSEYRIGISARVLVKDKSDLIEPLMWARRGSFSSPQSRGELSRLSSDQLYEALDPVMVRWRLRNVLPELGEVREIRKIIPLSDEQTQVIQAMRQDFVGWKGTYAREDIVTTADHPFPRFDLERRACVDLSLVLPSREGRDYTSESPKIREVDDIIEKEIRQNGKVVILVDFVEEVERLVERYDRRFGRGFSVGITGGVADPKERAEKIFKFRSEERPGILIGTPRLLGSSINLFQTPGSNFHISTLVRLSRPWRVLDDAQRLQGIGQTHPVTAHTLISEFPEKREGAQMTVEESQERLLGSEARLFSHVIDGDALVDEAAKRRVASALETLLPAAVPAGGEQAGPPGAGEAKANPSAGARQAKSAPGGTRSGGELLEGALELSKDLLETAHQKILDQPNRGKEQAWLARHQRRDFHFMRDDEDYARFLGRLKQEGLVIVAFFITAVTPERIYFNTRLMKRLSDPELFQYYTWLQKMLETVRENQFPFDKEGVLQKARDLYGEISRKLIEANRQTSPPPFPDSQFRAHEGSVYPAVRPFRLAGVLNQLSLGLPEKLEIISLYRRLGFPMIDESELLETSVTAVEKETLDRLKRFASAFQKAKDITVSFDNSSLKTSYTFREAGASFELDALAGGILHGRYTDEDGRGRPLPLLAGPDSIEYKGSSYYRARLGEAYRALTRAIFEKFPVEPDTVKFGGAWLRIGNRFFTKSGDPPDSRAEPMEAADLCFFLNNLGLEAREEGEQRIRLGGKVVVSMKDEAPTLARLIGEAVNEKFGARPAGELAISPILENVEDEKGSRAALDRREFLWGLVGGGLAAVGTGLGAGALRFLVRRERSSKPEGDPPVPAAEVPPPAPGIDFGEVGDAYFRKLLEDRKSLEEFFRTIEPVIAPSLGERGNQEKLVRRARFLAHLLAAIEMVENRNGESRQVEGEALGRFQIQYGSAADYAERPYFHKSEISLRLIHFFINQRWIDPALMRNLRFAGAFQRRTKGYLPLESADESVKAALMDMKNDSLQRLIVRLMIFFDKPLETPDQAMEWYKTIFNPAPGKTPYYRFFAAWTILSDVYDRPLAEVAGDWRDLSARLRRKERELDETYGQAKRAWRGAWARIVAARKLLEPKNSASLTAARCRTQINVLSTQDGILRAWMETGREKQGPEESAFNGREQYEIRATCLHRDLRAAREEMRRLREAFQKARGPLELKEAGRNKKSFAPAKRGTRSASVLSPLVQPADRRPAETWKSHLDRLRPFATDKRGVFDSQALPATEGALRFLVGEMRKSEKVYVDAIGPEAERLLSGETHLLDLLVAMEPAVADWAKKEKQPVEATKLFYQCLKTVYKSFIALAHEKENGAARKDHYEKAHPLIKLAVSFGAKAPTGFGPEEKVFLQIDLAQSFSHLKNYEEADRIGEELQRGRFGTLGTHRLREVLNLRGYIRIGQARR
ncbi:MAG: hypothetical protein HYT89_04160, partial [Candidatus Omnitrophica bacterium]|nr:hypothetical protein [Candidatus Omnitrophota bacterium]